MTQVHSDELVETIQELVENAKAALETETVERFTDFEKHINEVEAYVREVQQEMWRDQAKAAIKTIERGEPLTEADKEVIEAFLVSDADRYLKLENNFTDWKYELERLLEELTRRARMADRNNIADLRGVLKDAVRLVPDIRNYLEERSRVEKCKTALGHLTDPSRKLLAHLLREQLSSPKR